MLTKTQNDQPAEDVRLHPRTGELLKPLFTWHGGHVWPVLGGADGDDEGDGEPNSESDDDADDDTGEGDAEEGSKPVTRDEFDKLRKQLSAADKARAVAEKKLKEQEDAKKDELTKATERADAAEKRIQEQETELSQMRLQNAFLTADTGITWHDPGDALALAERKGYLAEVVGEDGKVDVKVLGAKLKELAKASPHLVKTGSGSSEGGAGGTRSGGSVGSGKGKDKDKGPDLSRYSRLLDR